MGQVSNKMRRVTGGYSHWCPGCEEMHILPDKWTFDGNLENPTFSPSFKHSGVSSRRGPRTPFVCHYILTAGVLNFCGDSTHDLAGRSVPLPQLPAEYIDACDHDFQGWRDHKDEQGRIMGGEQVCTKCGMGAMTYSLRTGF